MAELIGSRVEVKCRYPNIFFFFAHSPPHISLCSSGNYCSLKMKNKIKVVIL